LELLNQMKQLYGTLEDKEAELRDFIRNYEQRMRESDDTIKQVTSILYRVNFIMYIGNLVQSCVTR
jgi:glutathione peroxidase-family protein